MSRRSKLKQPAKVEALWRRYNDQHFRSFPAWPSPESLHPSISTVERAADGDLEARAIADAYAFRAPVVQLKQVHNV